MGALKPITPGAVAGTNTIDLDENIFGGFLLSTDGTNAGTVTVHDENSSGEILAKITSVQSIAFVFPIRAKSGKIYYSITGTGASAALYEWKE